jgi:hypothetical protein
MKIVWSTRSFSSLAFTSLLAAAAIFSSPGSALAKTIAANTGEVVYVTKGSSVIVVNQTGSGSRYAYGGIDRTSKKARFTVSPVCAQGTACPQFVAITEASPADVAPTLGLSVLKADDRGALVSIPVK